MKKLSNLMFVILSVAMLLIFAIVTLICGAHYEWLSLSTFWTVWLMTVLPIVIAVITVVLMLLKNGENELFALLPITVSTAVFEIVSLILGTVLTVALSSSGAEITWFMWVIELVAIVIYAVVLLYFVLGTKYIVKGRKEVKGKVFFIKNIVSQLNVALSSIQDENFKQAIEELKDNVRFSDPMGNDSVYDLEQEFCATVNGLVSRIEDGADCESCKVQIKKANSLLMQRNEQLKNSK